MKYALAQTNTVPPGVVDFVGAMTDAIINPILGVLFALALVYFLWGLMNFIFTAGDDTKRTEGKQHMLWGLVGMTIMVSVFGLLQLGLNTFGVDATQLPDELPLNSVIVE